MNANNSPSSAPNGVKVFKLKVGEQSFTVEVGDLHSRPILASVDGVQFEVWPDDLNGIRTVARPVQTQTAPAAPAPIRAASSPSARAPQVVDESKQVSAPIPGTIVAISVKPGSQVNPGDELLILEAMKMKNIIRATRSGTVASIFVTTGQTVNHHDPLLEYAE